MSHEFACNAIVFPFTLGWSAKEISGKMNSSPNNAGLAIACVSPAETPHFTPAAANFQSQLVSTHRTIYSLVWGNVNIRC